MRNRPHLPPKARGSMSLAEGARLDAAITGNLKALKFPM